MFTQLHQGDCLELMKSIPDGGVDMILCDLPYGTTACAWDTVIPFEPLWEQYKRIIKPKGAVVLFGSQPFTTDLIMSNRKWFRYCWVWDKVKPSSALFAEISPLKVTEDIVVFSFESHRYFPQMTEQKRRKEIKNDSNGEAFGSLQKERLHDNRGLAFPKNLISLSNANQNDRQHPTQKPVPLCEYLIRTYTNEGETVMDNTMGSGTTGVACVHTNRNFIGMELDPTYFQIAKQRIEGAQLPLL